MANAEKLKGILAAGVLTSSLLTGCGTGNNSESPKGCQVGTGNIEPGKGITVTVKGEPKWANCVQSPDGNYQLVISIPDEIKTSDNDTQPTATVEARQTTTPTPEPTVTVKARQELEETKVVVLHNSDGEKVEVRLPKNFHPDKNLRVSNISPLNILPIPEEAADFQKYLNTSDNPTNQPLAGYMYGTNDYNQYKDRQSGPQLPMYGWLIHTGEIVEIPGIGKVVGAPGKSVMVLIINRTDKVYQWKPNSVFVKSGFQGAGRIWNGEPSFVQETERRLLQHYGYVLGNGHPESGFIGQCDSPENCHSVTAVSVERIQWGNNPDGSPRYQFRLIRAEDIPLK